MPQITGKSFTKIYPVVKMQQICKEKCNSYFFKDECIKVTKSQNKFVKTLIFQNRNENIARISALVYKNFQGRNSSNISVAILENQCLHKFVLRLSDL